MKHLRGLYAPDNSSVHFEIKCGTGGAPVSIVQGAAKVPGSFDARIAKFDNDMGKGALGVAHSKRGDVEVIYCTPAIEATLLEILEPGKSYRNHITKACKKRLHKKYMSESDRIDLKKYDTVFSLEILNEARTRHARLNQLVEIFELDVRWQGYNENDKI